METVRITIQIGKQIINRDFDSNDDITAGVQEMIDTLLESHDNPFV